MAFARINYFSRSLQKASSVSVVFPDDPASAPAVVGLSTCCTACPTTTRSGCGGPASSATSRACPWWWSCPTAAGAGTPTPRPATPTRTT